MKLVFTSYSRADLIGAIRTLLIKWRVRLRGFSAQCAADSICLTRQLRDFLVSSKSELSFDGHLLVMVAQDTVRSRRHPVAGFAGEEIEPLSIPMIIE